MLPPSIDLKQAHLVYQHKTLFDHLNLTLLSGKCTCLLGPSGVGKTSLLRLIAGLDVGGEVTADIQASDGQPLQNRIAYMAQRDALLPWRTVLENVYLSLSLQGKKQSSEDISRAKHLLETVGLKSAINQYPKALSGGMRQRVALARTLFENKSIVLLDEPFASIDAMTKWRLQDLLAQLLNNTTRLLITHDPVEAFRLADRIYILSGCPARLSEEILLKDQAPRDLTHPDFQMIQAKIFQQLEKASL